ncbi:MAG: UDP-3-O-acyl-N-acetylglucosamine deacetylase [Syntrophobacteraceae bacterium]
MNNIFSHQQTLCREVRCEGVALHSGANVRTVLKPAPCDHGIRFRRMDLSGQPTISASFHRVVDTRLATSLGADGITVSTVEHLMAALAGLRIDNALVEMDGPEVPILDGSAAPFLDALRDAGQRPQSALRKYIKVQRPILVREGDAYIKAYPSDHFRVRYSIDFPHPLVGRQEYTFSLTESTFHKEIAKARTFGFLKDVQRLQSMGLARGGSLDNALVFDDFSVLNQDGFRFADECVRHKILDLLGDLALAGMPIAGYFEVHKAGHSLHHQFLKELNKRPTSYNVYASTSIPVPLFPVAAVPAFADPYQAIAKHM